MKQLNKFLNEYFSFSRKERNGIIVLTVVLFILIVSSYTLPYVIEQEIYERVTFKKDMSSLVLPARYDKETLSSTTISNNPSQLFKFDPNHLPEKDWLRLGLNKKQISMIKNFEKKGGRFYQKEDLKKIYSIKSSDYQRLESYITITTSSSSEEKIKYAEYKSTYKEKKIIVVDVNVADSSQLVLLNGIGPAFAKRIIKYRDRLGGFYNKEQLREIYGMDSSLYERIDKNILVNSEYIQKLNINSVTFDELKTHPYLNFNLANAIVNYRKQHGDFQDINDLKKIVIMNEDVFIKLQAYLTTK
jgi:competence protein ComEA